MASSDNRNKKERNAFDPASADEEKLRSPEAELAALVARDLRRYLTDQVGSLGRLAGGWTEQFGESSQGLASKGREEAAIVYAEAKRCVRENPVKSAAGSFAAGMIIGILTSR